MIAVIRLMSNPTFPNLRTRSLAVIIHSTIRNGQDSHPLWRFLGRADHWLCRGRRVGTYSDSAAKIISPMQYAIGHACTRSALCVSSRVSVVSPDKTYFISLFAPVRGSSTRDKYHRGNGPEGPSFGHTTRSQKPLSAMAWCCPILLAQ